MKVKVNDGPAGLERPAGAIKRRKATVKATVKIIIILLLRFRSLIRVFMNYKTLWKCNKIR